jgi:hypothetical protein
MGQLQREQHQPSPQEFPRALGPAYQAGPDVCEKFSPAYAFFQRPASDRQRTLEASVISQPRQENSCAEEMQKAVKEESATRKSLCVEEVLACL